MILIFYNARMIVPPKWRRAIVFFFFTFALKPRKTSRAPLTIHVHVGAAPTRTA
jgi:hypothetical protein